MTLEPTFARALTFLILSTAIYYLFARAEITRPLWSRYRGFVDRLARCPACSGFWIGAMLGAYLSSDHSRVGPLLGSVVLGAAWGLVVTPLGTWALVAALAATTIEPEPPPEQ